MNGKVKALFVTRFFTFISFLQVLLNDTKQASGTRYELELQSNSRRNLPAMRWWMCQCEHQYNAY